MKQQQRSLLNVVFDPAADLKLTRDFLDEHGGGLARAAYLLGGGVASSRVFLLMESVRTSIRLSRAHRRQLVDLHRLLTLQDVGDPVRIESGLFAMIDPDAPVVHDLCRLAEALEELLVKVSAEAAVEDQKVVDLRRRLEQVA